MVVVVKEGVILISSNFTSSIVIILIITIKVGEKKKRINLEFIFVGVFVIAF